MPPGSGGDGGVAIQRTGALSCFIIERSEVPAMMYAADGGDFVAAQVRIGIGNWMTAAFAPNTRPPRCATCEHTFEKPIEPEAFYLAVPMRGDGLGMVVGVCKRCVRRIGSDGLFNSAIEHFKKVWPKAVVTRSR